VNKVEGELWKSHSTSLEMEEGNKNKNGLFWKGMIAGMSAALLLWGVIFVSEKIVDLMGPRSTTVRLAEDSTVNSGTVQKLQLLEETIDKAFYLEKASDEEVAEGIYKGMIAALNDPYSEYYTEEELTDLMQQWKGIYYGIGAYVSQDEVTGFPKITGVIEGAPAQEVDLRANDIIYEVDGVSTYGLTLSEAVALIKGEEGSQVVLTIVREGEADYLKIPVTRRKVNSPTVEYEMLDEETGYIQIVEFVDGDDGEGTPDQFAEAMAVLKGNDIEGLVLDLRGNPGGSLSAVVEVARMILPQGLIVYTENKYGERSEYRCNGQREFKLPLVVLIDMNSASAAEILAGAIKDYEMGTLVGTTTYGKGIVQQVIPFNDGSAVKLTISSYYTPNGNNIHGTGITPDVECEFDGEAYYNTEEHYDNQLDEAKHILWEKMGR